MHSEGFRKSFVRSRNFSKMQASAEKCATIEGFAENNLIS
jgi:hypothetical protein